MPQSVAFWHFASGENLALSLYPSHGGENLADSTGVSLSEPDEELIPGFYVAEVADELHGLFRARVIRDGILTYDGLVQLPADFPPAVIDVGIPTKSTVTAFDQSALAQLASKPVLAISVPSLLGEELCPPLVRGDSYLAEHGRAVTFSRADFPDLPGGCTAVLTARLLDDETTGFSLAGQVAVATGTKVVRFQPTSADTVAYVPGKYRFDVEVRFPDGNTATFIGPEAYLRVLADVTRD